MFLRRSSEKEIIDNFSIKDERIDAALDELRIINRFLGGERISKEGIKRIFNYRISKDVKILDAGAGASDILLSLQSNNPDIRLFSIDKNLRACKYLRKNSTKIKIICADILQLPFKENYFDIIHASLFFHHFNEEELKTLLSLLKNYCKSGIIINDLRRNILAFIAIKILTQLFSKSIMVRNDAPISVRRGFIKNEILRILNSLDLFDFEIKRKWAFRWLIIINFKNYEL